jgi:hypothetical protein
MRSFTVAVTLKVFDSFLFTIVKARSASPDSLTASFGLSLPFPTSVAAGAALCACCIFAKRTGEIDQL